MAHHFLKKLFFEKNLTLTYCFLQKKFLRFFFQKIFTKITNIIFTYYQKFSDWQKLTENFQYPNFVHEFNVRNIDNYAITIVKYMNLFFELILFNFNMHMCI